MNLTPVISPAALAEMGAAVEHDEQQREGLGLEFADEFRWAVERARRFPERCSPAPGTDPSRGLRRVRLQRFPYLVYFVVELDRLWVFAVAHTRQKPGYWLHRVPGS